MAIRNRIKELAPVFKILGDLNEKGYLSDEMEEDIRMRLVRGDMAENEAKFYRGKQREAAAGYLGMTGDEYERFLKCEKVDGSLRLGDQGVLKRFFGMEGTDI